MPTRDVDALIAAGQLAEAAELLLARTEHARAAELFEQLWDFAAAARAARAAGDLPRALENALRGRDQQAAAELVALVVVSAGEDGAALAISCAEVCQRRGALELAGKLFQAAAQLDHAAECYSRAGRWADAARCHEALGQAQAAIDAYSRHLELLEQEQPDEDQGAERRELALPRYELGRLLLRFGRTEEALPLLQRAWGTGRQHVPQLAGRAVVAGLARLGYREAARLVLERMAAQLPQDPPQTVEQCLRDEELAPLDAEGGRVLAGRYRLGDLLGSGGMGTVYLGTDLLTDQRVAIKIFTAPGGSRGRDAFLRFVREARTTGQLQHPHIVLLHDFNEELGFMVLEHMAGGTLAQRLTPALELSTCRVVLLQVIEGLMAAHQRGVVHRDIKPSNIFFTTGGAAKLGDFGVAHLQDSGQTQTGAFIGTLAYMSPEQISGAPVTFATDIYALGVTLFQMTTGQLPFAPPDLVGQHLRAPAPAPSSVCPYLPPELDQVVARCLAKAPEERHSSLEQLRREVEAIPAEPERPATGQPQEQPLPAATRRATDRRFTVEGQLAHTEQLQLHQARDTELGRPVVLVRLALTDQRPALLALLSAAARAGPTLQRVLSLDAEQGQAVLQATFGLPLQAPGSRSAALRLCEDLGRALAALHAAGLAHGAVTAEAVTTAGPAGLLALTPALLADGGDSSPAQDVERVLELAGLPPEDGPRDGAALVQWARQEQERQQEAERLQRRQRLQQQALARRPGG